MKQLVLAAAFSLLAASSVPFQQSVYAEDESPDLKLEAFGKTGEREVTLVVTNISKWWSDRTTVTVRTISPLPGNVQTMPIGDLDPGQKVALSYMLESACDGHQVNATLGLGRNYEGVAETQTANNLVNASICDPVAVNPDVIDIGIVTRPDFERTASDIVQPEYMRPGAHAESFELHGITSRLLRKKSLALSAPFSTGDVDPTGMVGFSQKEFENADPVEIAQTAVSFDLTKLASLSRFEVDSAVLEYREGPIRWTSGSNAPQNKSGCVARIGKSTLALDAIPGNTLIPTTNIVGIQPGGLSLFAIFRSNDVSSFVKSHVSSVERMNPLTLVLLGELDDADGDDDTSCMSDITQLKLKVSYRIPNP